MDSLMMLMAEEFMALRSEATVDAIQHDDLAVATRPCNAMLLALHGMPLLR